MPYPKVVAECSPILATYCSSSVRTEGQLSFKYSNPSVSITAEKSSKKSSFGDLFVDVDEESEKNKGQGKTRIDKQ